MFPLQPFMTKSVMICITIISLVGINMLSTRTLHHQSEFNNYTGKHTGICVIILTTLFPFKVHLLLSGHKGRNFLTGLTSKLLKLKVFLKANAGHHNHQPIWTPSISSGHPHTLSHISSNHNNATICISLANLFRFQYLPTLHTLLLVAGLLKLHQISILVI